MTLPDLENDETVAMVFTREQLRVKLLVNPVLWRIGQDCAFHQVRSG